MSSKSHFPISFHSSFVNELTDIGLKRIEKIHGLLDSLSTIPLGGESELVETVSSTASASSPSNRHRSQHTAPSQQEEEDAEAVEELVREKGNGVRQLQGELGRAQREFRDAEEAQMSALARWEESESVLAQRREELAITSLESLLGSNARYHRKMSNVSSRSRVSMQDEDAVTRKLMLLLGEEGDGELASLESDGSDYQSLVHPSLTPSPTPSPAQSPATSRRTPGEEENGEGDEGDGDGEEGDAEGERGEGEEEEEGDSELRDSAASLSVPQGPGSNGQRRVSFQAGSPSSGHGHALHSSHRMRESARLSEEEEDLRGDATHHTVDLSVAQLQTSLTALEDERTEAINAFNDARQITNGKRIIMDHLADQLHRELIALGKLQSLLKERRRRRGLWSSAGIEIGFNSRENSQTEEGEEGDGGEGEAEEGEADAEGEEGSVENKEVVEKQSPDALTQKAEGDIGGDHVEGDTGTATPEAVKGNEGNEGGDKEDEWQAIVTSAGVPTIDASMGGCERPEDTIRMIENRAREELGLLRENYSNLTSRVMDILKIAGDSQPMDSRVTTLRAGEEYFIMTLACIRARHEELHTVSVDAHGLFDECCEKMVPFLEWGDWLEGRLVQAGRDAGLISPAPAPVTGWRLFGRGGDASPGPKMEQPELMGRPRSRTLAERIQKVFHFGKEKEDGDVPQGVVTRPVAHSTPVNPTEQPLVVAEPPVVATEAGNEEALEGDEATTAASGDVEGDGGVNSEDGEEHEVSSDEAEGTTPSMAVQAPTPEKVRPS